MQALPNGDWFVGWGQVPDFSELSPTGQLLFDAHFPAGDQSYRGLPLRLDGTPAHPPAFAVAAAVRRGARRLRQLERGDARRELAGARGGVGDAYEDRRPACAHGL